MNRKLISSGFWRTQILLFFLAFTPAIGKSHFILIQNPEKLEIRNQFEQKLTVADFQLLKPYRPLKLISNSEMLSDGVTKAMVVELAGKRFYVLMDGKKNPIRKKESGEWIQFDNLKPESGSGYLSRPEKFNPVNLSKNPEISLPAGTVAEKTASQNGRILVWIPSLGQAGWVPAKSLSSSLSAPSTENNLVQLTTPDSLLWVSEILSEANQVLKSACVKSGQKLIRFLLVQQKGSCLITVEGSTPDKFERSFERLSRKLALFANSKSVSVEQIDSGLQLNWIQK